MLKGISIWSKPHGPQKARAKKINQLVRAQTAFNRDNGGAMGDVVDAVVGPSFGQASSF